MKLSRRKFINSLSGCLFLFASKAKSNIFFIDEKNEINKGGLKTLIKPPALEEGSVVAITAPASPVGLGSISKTVKELKNLGLKVIVGQTILNRDLNIRYFSASDEFRAEEFNSFINDKDVRCILTARGGFGSIKILPMLDYDALKNDPKIIIGFSDITSLLWAITKKCGIITFHGPVASSAYTKKQVEIFKRMFIKGNQSEQFIINYPDALVFNDGVSAGELVGGNLSVICSLVGTEYQLDVKDKLLFLEETREDPYKVDRMLSHLEIAGFFDNAKAIIFGIFKNLNQRRNFFPNMSFTIKEVIENLAKKYNKPIIVGFPIGHCEDNTFVPIGSSAILETQKKTFRLLYDSVCLK